MERPLEVRSFRCVIKSKRDILDLGKTLNPWLVSSQDKEGNSRHTDIEPQTDGVQEQMETKISCAVVRQAQQVVRAAAGCWSRTRGPWPSQLLKEPTLPALYFKLLAPQNCDGIHLSCLMSPSYGNCFTALEIWNSISFFLGCFYAIWVKEAYCSLGVCLFCSGHFP